MTGNPKWGRDAGYVPEDEQQTRSSNGSGFGPLRNQLLASLNPAARNRVVSRMEAIDLPVKQVLYTGGKSLEHVYFPLTGVVSLILAADGVEGGEGGVEIGTVGNEGFVGLPLLLATDAMPTTAFSQVPGSALRMSADDFRDELDRNDELRTLLLRYTQALFNQVAQAAFCNRAHTIEQRCARWLLMTHDRVGRDEFPLTHEFLSQMLGVRRAGVTVAAGMLQRAGMIRYARGIIRIEDRPALEAAACTCYAIIRREFERLIGGTSTVAPGMTNAATKPARGTTGGRRGR